MFFSLPTSEATVSDSATATSVLPLKRFKFLAVKIELTTTGSQANCDCETPQTHLNKDLTEMHVAGQHPGALQYWHERRATYDCLADTALDLRRLLRHIRRTCVFCLWLTDSRMPQQNDKIT